MSNLFHMYYVGFSKNWTKWWQWDNWETKFVQLKTKRPKLHNHNYLETKNTIKSYYYYYSIGTHRDRVVVGVRKRLLKKFAEKVSWGSQSTWKPMTSLARKQTSHGTHIISTTCVTHHHQLKAEKLHLPLNFFELWSPPYYI